MTTLTCEYCETKFRTQPLLDKHILEYEKCKKYRSVLFTCLKCDYKTKGIKNIDTHMLNCEEPENKEEEKVQCVDITEEEKVQNKEEEKVQDKDSQKIIEKLLMVIKLEKFKSKFFKNIIDRNTNIKLDDIDVNLINTTELETIDKDTFSDGLFEIKHMAGETVNHYQPQQEEIEDKKKNDNERHIHRKISKNFVSSLVSEPTTDEVQEKIRRADEMRLMKINELMYNKGKNEFEDYDTDYSVVGVSESKNIEVLPVKKNRKMLSIDNTADEDRDETTIDECLASIKNSKKYTRAIENIFKINLNVFGSTSYPMYKRNLERIRDELSITLRSKNWNEKKITECISKCLSPMDKRIILYGSNFDDNLEIELINKLKASLFISISFPRTYVPIDKEELFSHFNNYGTAIFPIKDNMERILFNPYGFNNIIYVKPDNNPSSDDPYSYYIFTGHKAGTTNRLWNMDCRLANFSECFINNIRPNMIKLFRDIYKIVFSDNDFRSNYINSTSELVTKDCEQLLSNILILSNPIEFRNLLRQIVEDKATYKPTDLDKFDLTSDDKALKRKLKKQKEMFDIDDMLRKPEDYTDDDFSIIDVIKQLFDGITTDECVFFYKEIIMRVK